MCGIAGSIGIKHIKQGDFLNVLLKMKHRGPDSHNILSIEDTASFLGHVRLSIIDTSNHASQPMLDHSNRYVLVFNGEIYNYQEIKNELINSGASFNNNSDSEVILEAFKAWDSKMLDRFEGMFAFVIYDKLKNELFIARDRFGVKPFYYHLSNEGLFFSSELKTIKELVKDVQINEKARFNYFKLGNVQSNETIFQNIEPLPAGNYASFNIRENKLEIKQYWNPDDCFAKERKSLSREDILSEVKEYLKRSFGLRMVADVPVGIFLSGGIDSTLLSAILSKELGYNFSTFTIGFDNPAYDESSVAKATSGYLGLENISYNCSFEDFQNEFSKMYDYFDEPFADSSTPLTMLVSGIARESVKVSLSADGGDEFFGGYTKYYRNEKLYNRLLNVPGLIGKPASGLVDRLIGYKSNNFDLERLGVLEMASNLLSGKSKSLKQISKIEGSTFSNAEIAHFLPSIESFERTRVGNFSEGLGLSNIELLMLHDVQNYMSGDILKKVDMSTMSKSLEGREPFLDHNLFEFLGSVDVNSKFYSDQNKPILRDLLYTYIPKEIIDLPKRGFGAPLQKWSASIIYEYDELLRVGFQSKNWSMKYLEYLLENSNRSPILIDKLWTLLNYFIWEEKYFI